MALAAGALVSGCAASGTVPATSTSPGNAGSTAGGQAGTVWLCRPGMAGDPCAINLDSTAVAASGAGSVVTRLPAADSPFDCFYVYPTVSTEKRVNADLTVTPVERAAAKAQAAQFSGECNVWAPMYRQQTLARLALGLGTDTSADIAYASLLSAWRDYLANDNDGRPVILIGHSQGAVILMRLLQDEFDHDPVLRRRLVSAILLGGNVTVRAGTDTGGTFQDIPACTALGQTGCVVAYSSFLRPPPAGSLFGIPGQGVSTQLTGGGPGSAKTGPGGTPLQVVCTNPAALGGGSGALDPIFPTTATTAPAALGVRTSYVEYPGLYGAACTHRGNATWLQVTDTGPAGDVRPTVSQTLGPRWGLHLYDVDIALGNLLSVVAAQEAAYRSP